MEKRIAHLYLTDKRLRGGLASRGKNKQAESKSRRKIVTPFPFTPPSILLPFTVINDPVLAHAVPSREGADAVSGRALYV